MYSVRAVYHARNVILGNADCDCTIEEFDVPAIPSLLKNSVFLPLPLRLNLSLSLLLSSFLMTHRLPLFFQLFF